MHFHIISPTGYGRTDKKVTYLLKARVLRISGLRFEIIEGWMDGWMDGRMEGRMNGWMDGQTDG
jgi:hypothetical protein